jgi:hypothetical protein
MNGHASRRGPLGRLAVAVLVAGALVALPATAFAAKAATRIVVVSQRIVNHDTATTDLWPITHTAKLQKKSGSRWVGFKGAVKLYRSTVVIVNDEPTVKYVYVSTKTSSSSGSLSLSIPRRGKYRISYAGTSKLKACTGYSTILETIGDTVEMVGTPTYTPIAGGPPYMWWITVQYDVSWNTAVWDGPAVLFFQGELENDPFDAEWRDWVQFRREIFAPGIVEFNWKVENPGEFDVLNTGAGAYVPWDDYFHTPSWVEQNYGTP